MTLQRMNDSAELSKSFYPLNDMKKKDILIDFPFDQRKYWAARGSGRAITLRPEFAPSHEHEYTLVFIEEDNANPTFFFRNNQLFNDYESAANEDKFRERFGEKLDAVKTFSLNKPVDFNDMNPLQGSFYL